MAQSGKCWVCSQFCFPYTSHCHACLIAQHTNLPVRCVPLPQAFVDNIRVELQNFPGDVRDDVVILFSAHSLPMKVGLVLSLTVTCCVALPPPFGPGGQPWGPLPLRGGRYRSPCHGAAGLLSRVSTGVAVKGRNGF